MRTGPRSRWQLLVVPWGALVVWQCGVPAPQFHGEIMKVSADSINDYIKSLAFAPDPPHAQRELVDFVRWRVGPPGDRKSTRLNSSHSPISYAAFCLEKKDQGGHRYHCELRR